MGSLRGLLLVALAILLWSCGYMHLGSIGPALAYSSGAFSFKATQAASISAPTLQGSGFVSFSISPSLPAGLTFNTSTGAISGTPTGPTALTSYTVTAYKSDGSSVSGSVNIVVDNCVAEYVTQVLADSPASYWRLQETGGFSAADSGTGGNTGVYTANAVLNQVGPLAGNVSKAAFLNSFATTLLDVPTVTGLTYGGGPLWTMEFWVKAAATNTEMEIYTRNAGATKGFSIGLGTGPCTFTQFKIQKHPGASFCVNGWPNNTNWHHVVYVTDAVNTRLYVDSVQVGTNADTANYVACDGTCAVNIVDASGLYTMAEVAHYPGVALSPARISAHFAGASTCN